MKTLRILIAVAILLLSVTIASAQTVEVYNSAGKQDDSTWKNKAIQVYFSSTALGRWLWVGRSNETSPNGFDNNFTYIISRAKPIVTELPKGRYSITFKDSL